MRILTHLMDGVTGLAYPAQCQVCGSMISHYDDGVACAGCWEDPGITALYDCPICDRCGSPLERRGAVVRGPSCGHCETLPFAVACACGSYGGALEASIVFLKSQPHICRRLRDIICKTFSDQGDRLASDVIIPVPLHRRRLRERGYNQAELIANILARRFKIAVDARALVRIKETERHRIGLDAKDRAGSVERAFRVDRIEPI